MAPAPRAAPDEILTIRPHFFRTHRRQHRLGAEKSRFQVDHDGLVKIAFGQVIDAANDRHACIVDENVAWTQRRGDVINHLCHGGRLRHVGGDSNRAATHAFDLCHHRIGCTGFFPIVDRDGGTGFSERDGDGSSDATRCARHQRNVAIQIRVDGHDRSPCWSRGRLSI